MLMHENRLIHSPKSLKNAAISCRWITVGALVILAQYVSSRHWLGCLFPVGPWVSWPLVLLSRSPLLIWRDCEVQLDLTQTVPEGGVWHQLFVCLIMLWFGSSVGQTSGVFWEVTEEKVWGRDWGGCRYYEINTHKRLICSRFIKKILYNMGGYVNSRRFQ